MIPDLMVYHPESLDATFAALSDSPMPDSVVSIEFHERGNASEVVLRHEGLTDVEPCATRAWLERLS